MSGCTQVCNQGRDCTCMASACGINQRAAKVALVKARPTASETGNIWLAEPEPVEPLTRGEMLAVWGTVLVFGLASTVLMIMGAGYVWTRWLA